MLGLFVECLAQWFCSGLTLVERNEKLESMGAKYVKIDIGDLIKLEDGSVGFIIGVSKRYPTWSIKGRNQTNPCAEIPLLKGFLAIKTKINGPKPEPVFTVRFPARYETKIYFAREIAHLVRIGKWKLFKRKNHETSKEENP